MVSANIFEKDFEIILSRIYFFESSRAIWRSQYEGFVIAITHFDQ